MQKQDKNNKDMSYHELRKTNPVSARMLVRKILAQNNGNVSKTAKILGIDRKTVRRARDGTLEDLSRRPKNINNKTEKELENLIVSEAKETGFGYKRLTKYLLAKYGIEFSQNTVRAILKRNEVGRKRVKVRRGERSLYDYEKLLPFEKFQLDTKHLLDKNSLPEKVYNHIKQMGLPVYEWNLIDVSTRTRFTAYSYRLNSSFGFLFIFFCLLWLRMHNVTTDIEIRLDNGSEFCSGSRKKLAEWNSFFGNLGAVLEPIPPGMKHLQGIVENSHRRDDEEFLIPHVLKVKNSYQFLTKAQMWQDAWNFYRPHFGKGMGGRTPYQVLKDKWNRLVNLNVISFPVFLVEDLFIIATRLGMLGGEYVLAPYRPAFFCGSNPVGFQTF